MYCIFEPLKHCTSWCHAGLQQICQCICTSHMGKQIQCVRNTDPFFKNYKLTGAQSCIFKIVTASRGGGSRRSPLAVRSGECCAGSVGNMLHLEYGYNMLRKVIVFSNLLPLS